LSTSRTKRVNITRTVQRHVSISMIRYSRKGKTTFQFTRYRISLLNHSLKAIIKILINKTPILWKLMYLLRTIKVAASICQALITVLSKKTRTRWSGNNWPNVRLSAKWTRLSKTTVHMKKSKTKWHLLLRRMLTTNDWNSRHLNSWTKMDRCMMWWETKVCSTS